MLLPLRSLFARCVARLWREADPHCSALELGKHFFCFDQLPGVGLRDAPAQRPMQRRSIFVTQRVAFRVVHVRAHLHALGKLCRLSRTIWPFFTWPLNACITTNIAPASAGRQPMVSKTRPWLCRDKSCTPDGSPWWPLPLR
jgi:hypothetical protein